MRSAECQEVGRLAECMFTLGCEELSFSSCLFFKLLQCVFTVLCEL